MTFSDSCFGSSVSTRAKSDVPSAFVSNHAFVGSVTRSAPVSVRSSPEPIVFRAETESVLAPSVRQNGRLNPTHSMQRMTSAATSPTMAARRREALANGWGR